MEFTISFHKRNGDDNFLYEVKLLWGLVHFKYNIPGMKITEESKVDDRKSVLTLWELFALVESFHRCALKTKNYYQWLREMLCKVEINQLHWKTIMGVGDAVGTAFICAAFHTLKSILFTLIFIHLKLDKQKTEIDLIPLFNFMYFETLLEIRLRLSAWNSLIIGAKFAYLLLRSPGSILLWWRLVQDLLKMRGYKKNNPRTRRGR